MVALTADVYGTCVILPTQALTTLTTNNAFPWKRLHIARSVM